jgi:hypothetical protein
VFVSQEKCGDDKEIADALFLQFENDTAEGTDFNQGPFALS